MKCPKCHAEVEPGSLYCPRCLTEIPWVQEFSSIETLMEKKKREEPEHLPSQKPVPKRRRLVRSKKAGVVLCVLIAVFLVMLCYRQLHTFSALYNRANKAYINQDFDKAFVCLQEALEKQPDNLSANLLLARLLEEEDDAKSAIMVLQPMVKMYQDNVPLYQLMVRLLSYEGRTGEIKKLLEACDDQKVLEACADYVCMEPVSSLPPGTYTSVRQVELSAEYKRIYYTLDGSMPTQSSPKYSGPITLNEGTTELNAFGINDNNIPSGIITRKYVIVLNEPEPPEITPESGNYTSSTKIEVKVPDGCRAYYAFDQVPTVQSTEYVRPVAMPQGYHVFNVILVAANGKVSENVSKNYYLEY
ncbi:chitobiase/beta-hexosaminidase C-terminal domain-containing protein [Blautia schinkii]|nr:chitobiase/beta-hexosaminidase C-terminal domain-containing protein [Blautia schinkii]